MQVSKKGNLYSIYQKGELQGSEIILVTVLHLCNKLCNMIKIKTGINSNPLNWNLTPLKQKSTIRAATLLCKTTLLQLKGENKCRSF